MARIEDTGGNVTYTIYNCDCGLTGGCWKCQPMRFSKQFTYKPSARFYPEVSYKPIQRKETYAELGIRLKAEIDEHPEWGAKLI